MESSHFTARDLEAMARASGDDRYAVALEHGTLELGYFTPVGVDVQQPHARDEVYVIVGGHGQFRLGDQLMPFEPGDALFVPAGMEHRFVAFSEDTAMWVIFYGPAGGEVAV